MKFSILKQDMTPDKPVFMAGFGIRERKSDGVADSLYFKAVLLQENQTLLMLAFDALGGDRSFVIGLKEALGEKFGFKEEEILINFSHSHSSVFLTGVNGDPAFRRGGYSMGQERWIGVGEELDFTEDVSFYLQLRDKVLLAVDYCFTHLQEGRLLAGVGKSEVAVSRRLMTDKGIRFKPNYEAETDQDVFVLKLVDENERIKGILFNYGCHPTCMSGYQISAEFVGQACMLLESKYCGATAVFLQGCTADMNHRGIVKNGEFKSCTVEETQAIGNDFGAEIANILENEHFAAINCHFRTRMVDLQLYTQILTVADIEAVLENETLTEFRKLAARKLLKAIKDGRDKRSLRHYIQSWHLDENTGIIAQEGEIPAEFGLKIKKLLKDKKIMTLGYSNGVSTYIPTRKILREGGYEAEAVVIHGFRGPLIEETEDMIYGAIAGMELLGV
jgi:hypothetical protein